MKAIKFKNKRLFYLDQTLLPLKEEWKECLTLASAVKAVKTLKVRGAPLIGVFSAYALYVTLKDKPEKDKTVFLKTFEKTAEILNSTRPTAVNLSWALSRIREKVYARADRPVAVIKQTILREARFIEKEDEQLCFRIAEKGLALIDGQDRILTHCNAGFLATAGNGTALAVIYAAAEKYKNIRVYADETRPLLQGARLTCWELMKNRVPVTLICDNMAAVLMAEGKVDKVIVGADRIAANGDAANKIGTYSLAVNAAYHKIPFYVAAPFSTFDLSLVSGKNIPIEERDPEEIKKIMGRSEISPRRVKVYNPAFDVTPYKLISAIITDKGVIKPPFKKNIKKILKK